MAEPQASYFWVMTVEDDRETELSTQSAIDPGNAFENLMENEPEGVTSGGKGVGTTARNIAQQIKQRVKPVAVPVQTVENNMKHILTQLGGMLQRVQAEVKDVGGMELDEIEVQLEISGTGEIGFMGTGVEAGSRGAIVLRFKRHVL